MTFEGYQEFFRKEFFRKAAQERRAYRQAPAEPPKAKRSTGTRPCDQEGYWNEVGRSFVKLMGKNPGMDSTHAFHVARGKTDAAFGQPILELEIIG